MAVTVAGRGGVARLVPPLRALVRAALDAADRRAGAIGLTLTGDDEIRALNRRWRRLDRATDVLSFGYDEAAGATPVDGDLVVSMERVMVQARRYRVTPGRELARLVIHGALHLAGLDHATATERRAMRRSEARVLAAGRAAIAALDRALAARRRGAGRPH